MSDLFWNAKLNAEKEIIGMDFAKAKAWLQKHYMEIVVYDSLAERSESRLLRVQVAIDNSYRVTGIVGWF